MSTEDHMTANKLDEREEVARDCLAKAVYCEWVADRSDDNGHRKYLLQLAVKWKEAAKQAERAD